MLFDFEGAEVLFVLVVGFPVTLPELFLLKPPPNKAQPDRDVLCVAEEAPELLLLIEDRREPWEVFPASRSLRLRCSPTVSFVGSVQATSNISEV